MSEQPQETIQFVLNQAFSNHSELVKSDANFTKIVRWVKQRQNLVTTSICEKAIMDLYPELKKHQSAEPPKLSVYEQQQNAKHNQELFERLNKDPRLARIKPEGGQMIQDWLTKVAGDPSQVRYDEELVLAAIHNLGSKLPMYPAPAPPPPPPPPNPPAGLAGC